MGSRRGPARERAHRTAPVRPGWARALVLVAAVLLAGCYWSKYDKLARTNVQLLLAMAQKLDDVLARENGPAPDLEEYRYPLERARDFARIVGPRFEGRDSLTRFRTLCDTYERLVAAGDEVRREPANPTLRAAFAHALAALRQNAIDVLAALNAERARG